MFTSVRILISFFSRSQYYIILYIREGKTHLWEFTQRGVRDIWHALGKMRNACKQFCLKLEGKRPLQRNKRDVGVMHNIKMDPKEIKCWACSKDSLHLWYSTVAGCCEHGNEHFWYVKGGEFCEKLNNYQLVKKDCSALDGSPCCFTPGEGDPSTHWIGGWLDPRACLGAVNKRKFLYCRESNPGRPHSNPLWYRLSHPDSIFIWLLN
jgi:hypothetical protein